jgi:hypothetical protein
MSKNHYEMTQVASANLEINFLRDEVRRLKIESKDCSKARELLKRNGYYVDSLWTTGDVTQNYECSDELAYKVLDNAMHNEATMEQIFLAIDYMCDDLEIKKIKD